MTVELLVHTSTLDRHYLVSVSSCTSYYSQLSGLHLLPQVNYNFRAF